jgi:phosphatidylglycerophosphate synthase
VTGPDDDAVPDRAEFARRWSQAHGGADPTARWVGGYLTVVHRAARPVAAARVAPDAVTVVGLLVALSALVPAAAGGRWALVVPVLVVVSAMVDGVDGAVAVLTGRSTRWGAVLDAVCDRLADAAYCAVLWLLGAPGWLVVAAAGTGWLHEYVRARAGAAGMTGVGRVTVAERPTRVVVAAAFALGAGLYPASGAAWAAAGASATAVIGLVGLAQLLPTVRRNLA